MLAFTCVPELLSHVCMLHGIRQQHASVSGLLTLTLASAINNTWCQVSGIRYSTLPLLIFAVGRKNLARRQIYTVRIRTGNVNATKRGRGRHKWIGHAYAGQHHKYFLVHAAVGMHLHRWWQTMLYGYWATGPTHMLVDETYSRLKCRDLLVSNMKMKRPALTLRPREVHSSF